MHTKKKGEDCNKNIQRGSQGLGLVGFYRH